MRSARVLFFASPLIALVVVCAGAASDGDGAAADPACATGVIHAGAAHGATCCCPAEYVERGELVCQDSTGRGDGCCCGAASTEGRSCDVAGPPCTMVEQSRRSARAVYQKRGFVADGTASCDTPLLLNASGWFYDYNVENPFRTPGIGGNCALMNASARVDQRFSPMNWCLSSLDTPVPPYVNRTYFMGFNEPNNLHNCNTSPELVARAWGTVMRNWTGSHLVSPATAGDGIAWFDQFFGNCTKLYGKGGCRISYLAAHDYSCTPEKTVAYLKQLHDRYGYKVWMTEFSCGDHAAGRPTSDHLKFMQEILPMLDAADYVFRYAWMSAIDSNSKRGLVAEVNGKMQLTELGKVYQGLS